MNRLLALASSLVAAGCGAETVGSDGPLDTSSYRVEVHSEVTGIGLPDSFTSTTLVNGEAGTLVEEESGSCDRDRPDVVRGGPGCRRPSRGQALDPLG